MPYYHFEIVNGFRLEDPVGLQCHDHVAARRRADMIARQIAEDVPARQTRTVVLIDDHGTEIYKAPVRVKG